MKKITIKTPSSRSEIACGKGALARFAADCGDKKTFIITDSNVNAIYGGWLKDNFPKAEIYVIRAGENSKNCAVLLSILKRMVQCGLSRKSRVIAFGGGVVGDIAGLAASLYMRGVELVQVPTTLLAQVDSSVGGKTAVDMCGVKNVIGAFYQPSRVIADPLFLSTLPRREIRCGLGEIIKYGALNGEIFDKLCENSKNLSDKAFLTEIIPLCILHKARVVMDDERDLSGERKSLNMGHTTGHAFELRYKRRSHGEFVLIGMYYELAIACDLGYCNQLYADKLRSLILRVVGKIPSYSDVVAAKYDKKNENQVKISLVVPAERGEWREITLDFADYESRIKRIAEKAAEND